MVKAMKCVKVTVSDRHVRSETTQQRARAGANPMYNNIYDASEIGKHVNHSKTQK